MKQKGIHKSLRNIRGLTVAITGTCWIKQHSLRKLIRKRGGKVTPSGHMTSFTDVLIRGASSAWKYQKFGLKEARAAELIQSGKPIMVVHDYEVKKLLEYEEKGQTPASERPLRTRA